jgi:hypothetical protein
MPLAPFLRWFFPRNCQYAISRSLFIRGVGFVYLIAIASWWVQAEALIGKDGLVPAADYLQRVGDYFDEQGESRFWNVPTLLWISSSDEFIAGICALGMALAFLVIAGFVPGPCLLGLWVVYLSLVNTGSVFMSFQWDILLLETTILTVLVAPWSVVRMRWRNPPPLGAGERLVWWLCWIAVAKLMFQSGWVKLAWATPSQSEWWPDHTALTFHYMTQPIPTWTAWWMHQLPEWLQKASLWPMYGIELILPFLVFLGARLRLAAGSGFVVLMMLILVTGNYAYFNWLTLVLCLPLVADRFWSLPRRSIAWLRGRLGKRPTSNAGNIGEQNKQAAVSTNRLLQNTSLAVRALPLTLIALLNFTVFFNDLYRVSQISYLENPVLPWTHLKVDPTPEWADELHGKLSPFNLVSGYGLFRSMTTDRPEIIIEGSSDGVEWQEYDVRWKPDKLDAPPRFVAPHQPRVAWQFWFAALERQYHPRSRNATWMARLFRGLLENDPVALSFFNDNPFPDHPPKILRARLFLYEFTTIKERRESGNWWKRELAGDYLPAITKSAFQ